MEKNDFTFFENNKSRFIVWGTGDLFQKICGAFKINIDEQVICFVETQPKTSSLYGKKIISIKDYLNIYSESLDNNRILIASSFVDEICLMLKKENIDEKLIYDGYKWYERWSRTEKIKQTLPIFVYRNQFTQFLSQDHQLNNIIIDEDNEIVIFVKWWGYSLIPYFQITLGILLHLKGVKVKFLLDDYSKYDDLIKDIDFIKEATSIFENHLNVVQEKYSIKFAKLSEQVNINLTDLEEKKISRSIYHNKVWQMRKIIFDDKDNLYFAPLEDQFIKSAKKIKGYFLNEKPKKVFAFTAAHVEFAIIKDFCNLYGVDVYSSENFRHSYSYSISGPTVCQNDIELFNQVIIPEKVKKYLLEISDKHIYKVSMNNYEDIINCPYVLIPINIFWDSASYTEKDAFESFEEWLLKTIKFLIEKCFITVIVRQHPDERKFGTGLDLKDKLLELFGASEKFIFISCNEDINTYELIKHAALILPNTSTVGVESAMLKKTVVVKNDVYYSDSDFVLAATTEEEYFNIIKNELVQSTFELTDSRVEKAKLYFALSSIIEIPKTFGHDTEDVLIWINSSFDDLLKDQGVKWMLQSFKENKPLISCKLGI